MIDETKIMQYADGTLPIGEREEVQKAIEADPKLKELYNTFKETGDLLFKLSNEVKSKPLPQNLQKKAEILKSWNKPVIKDKDKSINFFGLFKFQYAGVAAAFCLFFIGGFFTNTFLSKNKTDLLINESPMIGIRGNDKIDKLNDLKTRSLRNEDEELSTRIINFYKFFDENIFNKEINMILGQIKIGEKFKTKMKDGNNRNIEFIFVREFQEDEKICKTLSFNERVKLSNEDTGTKISLITCLVGDEYKLTSINIEK